MRRRGWVLLGAVAALLAALLAATALLVMTERGLQVSLQLAQRVAPGDLEWGTATGQLIGPLRLENLEYRDDGNRYRVGRLDFDWSPGRLLARRLSIRRLRLDAIEIELAARADEPPATPAEPGWSLPLELVLRDLSITNLSIRSGAAEPLVIDELSAEVRSGLESLDIEMLRLRMAQLEMDVNGRLGLGARTFTDLTLDWRATPPDYAPVAAHGRLSGTWQQALLSQHVTSPIAAQAELAIRDPFAELRWVLELNVPATLLTDINTTWPAQRVGGVLKASGDLNRAELGGDVQTDWAATQLYTLRVDLNAARDDEGRLQVQPLVVQHGESRISLTAHWDPVQAAFDARLDAQALGWPLDDAQVLVSAAQLQADGTVQDYQLTLNAQLEGPNIPAAEIRGAAHGNSESLRVDDMEARLLDGRLQGQGQVAWAPALAWDLQVVAEQLNPGRQWPAWPGKVSAQLRGAGSTGELGSTLTASIQELTGELRGYPVGGRGGVRMHAGRIDVEAVQLTSGDARLEVDGTLAEDIAIGWQLRAPKLQQLAPDMAGTLNADGGISGTRAEPRLQARATLNAFAMRDLRLDGLNLDADLGLQPGAALRLAARGTRLRLAERSFDTLRLDLDGRLEQHAIDLLAQGADHELQVSARGGWDGVVWDGRLEHADWRLPETGAWYLGEAATLRLGAQSGKVENTCWRQEGTTLCAEYDYSPDARQMHARLSAWPLANLHRALPPAVRIQGGELAAQLSAELPTMGIARGEAQLQLTPGTLTWQETGQHVVTDFGGADAALHLDASGARATAQLRLSGADHIQLEARLPEYQPGVSASAQPLRGELQGEVRDFSLLDALVSAIDEPAGVLRLDAALDGTLAAPQLRGDLRLSEGRAYIGPAGVQLEDWQLELSGDPIAGRLNLRSRVRSGPGAVSLNGWLAQLGSPGLSGELRLSGDRFEAVNLPEARVLISPDLRAGIREQAVDVSGGLHIPEARIAPRDLSGAVTPSKDVVLVRGLEEEEASPPGWTVTSRVRLSLGDAVHFDGFGLSGRLTGALDTVDMPERVTLARGELAVKDGLYKAYGQELQIEQGRVLYRDSPLDNPGLDVRAVRKTGDVVAGVRVLGTAQDPVAELYSTPSMPQADVLSYLLLGRPVANASGGDTELLAQAATSLGLKGGNALAESLGHAFGLDEVSVGGDGDLESTALTVGKYLSPRLYVNYSVGLLDAANRLQMRYDLSKRLSIQTETGAATGGDILYRIER